MKYEIFHETSFNYASIVTFSHNIARLQPKDSVTQKLLEYSLTVEPTPYESSEFVDFFENKNNYMIIREPHTMLKVTAKSKVEINEVLINENIAKLKEYKMSLNELRLRLNSTNVDDILAKQYLFETDSLPSPSPMIKAYILESFQDERDVVEAAIEFMGRIFNDFEFVSGFSDIMTPIESIFEAKKGVCQDFAQFGIAALRSIGIPTRYISGYIQTLPPEGESKLFGADASHAWYSIYIPGFGWVDFDPTNNKIPNEEYIVLGYGRDYHDISPLKGVVQSSGDSNLFVKVNVEKIEDEPTIQPLQYGMQQQFQK